MAGLVLTIILISVFTGLSYQQLFGGEYYTVIKGFFPRTSENEYMSYRLEVVGNPKDHQDRKLRGFINMKAPITDIGFMGVTYKKSGTQWLILGKNMTEDNLCKLSKSFENFEKCFSGTIEKSDCSLSKGNHTINDYDLGEDLKYAAKFLPFGEYKMDITMTGKIGGELVRMADIQYLMDIANAKLKPQVPPPGASEKKRSGKNKSG